jgi:hypothetical protein
VITRMWESSAAARSASIAAVWRGLMSTPTNWPAGFAAASGVEFAGVPLDHGVDLVSRKPWIVQEYPRKTVRLARFWAYQMTEICRIKLGSRQSTRSFDKIFVVVYHPLKEL